MTQTFEHTAQLPATSALRNWMTSPGGLYNLGNGLGLASGVTLCILGVTAASTGEAATIVDALTQYFVGDLAAVALSVAMVIFFYSGLQYDRAWAHGAPPNARFNRSGDLWSGVGALVLGVGLLALGQPFLAATAGLLHAIGKFGSAWAHGAAVPGWPKHWPDLWRSAVLVSRAPAMLAAALAMIADVQLHNGPGLMWVLAPSATLLACYVLWVWADLKLFRS
ncbi:hypothetical protein ACS3SW_17505 [Roseobacteraceae bacterium S113]